MNWWDDLCEYYNVSKEEAIELGTRKTGRKPNLPASKTCKAVSGMTMEELWDFKPRETLQEKMDFYKDIGAWQTFRQCNYRQTFNYSRMFFSHLKEGCNVLEYGCGVAPLTNCIVEKYKGCDISSMTFHLVDVGGEHLEFAKWRLKKKCPNINVKFHEITSEYSTPVFDINFDIVCIMDVFEHLPNPLEVITNITDHTNDRAFLVETWRKGAVGGCDLQEAEDQRRDTMKFINSNYKKVKGGSYRCYVKR
jgi:SAM-dependent methyltransferase